MDPQIVKTDLHTRLVKAANSQPYITGIESFVNETGQIGAIGVEAELIPIADHFQVIGKRAASLMDEDWRLVAILRENKMFFPDPDTIIEVGDRLVIVGQPDTFKTLCTQLECGIPHFPLGYGPDLLLALLPGSNHRILTEDQYRHGQRLSLIR